MKLTINTPLGMGSIIFGAAPGKCNTPNGRDYDYSMGWGINGSAALTVAGKLFFGLNYRGGWLATINGTAPLFSAYCIQ